MIGACRQEGHANPPRRGSFATLASTRACISPRQQFSRMNTHRMPNHTSRAAMARQINARHAYEPNDDRHHQAARASKDKPEERLENLPAIQRIDRQHVEDQQGPVDDADRLNKGIGVGHRLCPARGAAQPPEHAQHRAPAPHSPAAPPRCSTASRRAAAAAPHKPLRPAARARSGSPARPPAGRPAHGQTRASARSGTAPGIPAPAKPWKNTCPRGC